MTWTASTGDRKTQERPYQQQFVGTSASCASSLWEAGQWAIQRRRLLTFCPLRLKKATATVGYYSQPELCVVWVIWLTHRSSWVGLEWVDENRPTDNSAANNTQITLTLSHYIYKPKLYLARHMLFFPSRIYIAIVLFCIHYVLLYTVLRRIKLLTSRLDTTRHVRRVESIETSVSNRAVSTSSTQ